MSYLQQAKKAHPTAPIITIVGFPGTGKTTLGGLFPSSIFIQAENASTVFETMPVDQQPTFMPPLTRSDKKRGVKTSDVIRDQLRELVTVEHPFKTVVFDSVTALNDLFEHEVVEYDNKNADSIGNAAGGYHKGYDVVASMHAEVRRYCEHLRLKGMAVIFLSHTGIVKMKNRPDETSEYTAFSLGMNEKSRSVYVKYSDAVLYLKSQQIITGGEENRKGQTVKAARVMTTGDRILITSSDGTVGYIDAKNRYDGMPQEIPVEPGQNPIMQYVPFYNQSTAKQEQ